MDDEQHLRDIQQQLARAWVERDRAFIERILAPEWSVTQANGTLLSRAALMGSAFETEAFRVTRLVVDDVTVDMFGTTAVVRGRTVATGTDKGLSIDVQLRFTDVFLKRMRMASGRFRQTSYRKGRSEIDRGTMLAERFSCPLLVMQGTERARRKSIPIDRCENSGTGRGKLHE